MAFTQVALESGASYSQLVAKNLVRTSDGVIHIFFSKHNGTRNQIRHGYSSNNGATWTYEYPLADTGYPIYQVAATADSSDNIFVAFISTNSSHATWGQVYVVKYTKATTSWGTPSLLTNTDTQYRYLKLTCDINNKIHLIWCRANLASPYRQSVEYAVYTTSWSGVTSLTNSSYDALDADVCTDNSGNVYVVYAAFTSSYPSAKSIMFRKFTTSWAGEVFIQNGTADFQYAAVHCTIDNRIFVVYTHPSNDASYYQFSSDGGQAWSNQAMINYDAGGYDSARPMVSSDTAKTVYFYYQKSNASYYLHLFQKKIPFGGSLSAEVAMDAAGNSNTYDTALLSNTWARVNSLSFGIPKTGYFISYYGNAGGGQFVAYESTNTWEDTATEPPPVTFTPKVYLF